MTKRHHILLAALVALALIFPLRTSAQSVVNLVNGDSIVLDACELGSGTIYDNGGANGNYSNNFDGWVLLQASPGITITLTGNYSTESCCDKLTVEDGTTTLFGPQGGTGTVNVSTTAGQMLIRFHTDGGSTYSGFALQWSTSGYETVCTNPVTGLDTTAVTTTSIGLTWSATNAAGPFMVVCGDQTFTNITTTSYTVTGLNPSTTYEISVVASSAAGSMCCADEMLVRTACGNAALPYKEGFEGMAEGSFPSCWLQVANFDSPEEFLPQVVSAQHSSGSRSLLLSCGGTASDEHFGIVATPPLEGVGSHTVRLMLRASHYGTRVEFGTCDSAGSLYNQYGFTPVQSVQVNNTDSWQEYRFTWTSNSDGQRLALRMLQSQQGEVGHRLYIDNMGVENCGVDSVRTIHVEYDRLDLVWSTYGNPTCTVGVRREGAVTDTMTFTNVSSPLPITGLAAETKYIFTVYPTCSGSLNISRSVTTRTTPMPTAAAGFCSNFSEGSTLPNAWTYTIMSTGCNGYFAKSDRSIYYYEGCSNGDAIMASEQLTGLAGRDVTVTFVGYDGYGSVYSYSSKLILGTMVYADDPSTFVPLDSVYVDRHRHTLSATVPTNSTGRHIAIRMKSQYSWMQFNVYSVSCTGPAVEEPVVEHRRGTSMVIRWAQAYDTVLVQYGSEHFAIGTGTIDTFYHVTRGTLHGLTPNTNYDLFVYRPGQTLCEDMRYTCRTAMLDYPLPYCEDFSTLTSSDWYNGSGDWQRLQDLNGRPSFDGHPYYGLAGKAMTMSSWGFAWNYYSMAMLPDVEVDSQTVLSFFIYDQAPQSTIYVGMIRDDYYSNSEFELLDTIHINACNQRVHYSYAFRPSDTLFNGRIVLSYRHPYEYSYYNCYIDELHLSHTSYGTLQHTYVGFDTVAFNLTTLQGADSVEVTLIGGGQTYVDTLALADIHNFGFGGLDTGTLYRCYLRPLDGGCPSLAGHVITQSNGTVPGVGSCFPFSQELSYELPYRWAADSATTVTTGDYLELVPRGRVATHPMTTVTGRTFSFRARGHTAGDTLRVGLLPADSISVDSTHFSGLESNITPIDTVVVGTAWQYYMLRLPAVSPGAWRIVLQAGNDTMDIDEPEFSDCPIVHVTVEGNSIICTLDNDQVTNYYLTVDDSAGTDHRVIYVEENPYRLNGLAMSMRYDLTWYCPYGESACRPTISVHTGGTIPLPYCVDFNVGTGGSLSVPPTWTFITNSSNDQVTLSTDGPSLDLNPYYSNKWMYAVMPDLDVDSALSMHAYFYTWSEKNVEIGVMNSATDTASFIPLWSQSGYYSQRPEVELSGHLGKRVAIRTKTHLRLWNVHFYGYPLAKMELLGYKRLKVKTDYPGPYWLHYYYGSQDTMIYVDTTDFMLNTFPNHNYAYLGQTDSAGYNCESYTYSYYLGTRHSLPYCYSPGYSGLNTFSYQAYGHQGVNYLQRSPDNKYVQRFYGNSSSWMVMGDHYIDSINHAGMRVRFDAGSQRDTVVVGVMVNAYDTNTFSPVDTLVYTRTDDSLQSEYVNLSRYADTGRWVAFHHLPSPNSQWFDIHNVYMESCPGALSATVSLSRWNRVKIDGEEVPFYVEYGHSGQGQGSWSNTIMRVDSVPIILTLDPETRYDFYFRCDSAGYTCVPKQEVTTLAAPMELPTCVDFDTVAVTLIPRNWTSRNAGIGAANTAAHSGTNSLVMPVASNSYIITPDINVDSIEKVALSLWYRVEDLSDRLVVGVMSNPADISTFYPVRTLAPMEAGVWQHGLVEFSSAPSESHFIALRARSNRQGGGRNIYVDDIYVTNCAAFDFTVQRLTSNSIDLTWSHLGEPNITVTVVDDSVVTATYTNVTPPLHIEPLNILHYYTFRFNSTCNSTDSGYCTTNYTDSLSVVTPAPGAGCVNPTDLASPQAVFFSGSYSNPYSQAGAINYGSMHPDSRHTVCYDTAQRDPRTGGQLRTIPEGYTSSVRLGNWSSNYYMPEAEGVIYSLMVDTGSFELLLLRYAAVLQDPQHAASDQPRFRMELLDTNYNIIDSACTSADFIADQNLGWHTADDGVLWKDWTAVGVDLSNHAGEQVYFRLTTYDCNEGSHYGYAYFTLECMRKNMNTVSCGDVDSNTLSAPEGFNYRWYNSNSPATISTAQSITVPSEDITYFCEVSKLDNPSCNFTISAYGGTRYPMANFDTSMVIDSCRFIVTFTNTSGISNDGINPLPGEQCETAYWDFGNGTTSVNYHGSAMYLLPGTYTVQLISGIALDECQDTMTMTLVLELPAGTIPSDTTEASICDNQSYTFFGQPYNIAGEYYHVVDVPNNTCDSIYVLQLEVRLTSSSDSVAVVCDSIHWRGQTYTTDGTYSSGPIGLNAVNCDTSVNLVLTVHPTFEANDSIIICPYRPFIYRGVDYGGPAVFDTTLYSIHNCDSVVHVILAPRDSNFRMKTYYYFDTLPYLETDTMLISCTPTTLNLTDSTSGVTHWDWKLFMPDTVMRDSLPEFSYEFTSGSDSAVAYATLVTTSAGNCLDTASWPVFVFPSPHSEFIWDPLVPSIMHPDIQFINQSTPDTNQLEEGHDWAYLWRIQSIEGGEYDTTSDYAPHYQWGNPGDNMSGDYNVELINYWTHPADSFYTTDLMWLDPSFYHTLLYPSFTHTCIDTAKHVVTVTNEYLQFPNLVTPNGDGVNDRWEVMNLIEMGNYSMNELWIYDRTGALVYHVRYIRSADQFWDPEATRSPDGTYYYRFVAEGEYGVVKRNGLIEVLRK